MDETIWLSTYGTRAGIIAPKVWGVVTTKNKTAYVPILEKTGELIILEVMQGKVISCQWMKNNNAVNFSKEKLALRLVVQIWTGMKWIGTLK